MKEIVNIDIDYNIMINVFLWIAIIIVFIDLVLLIYAIFKTIKNNKNNKNNNKMCLGKNYNFPYYFNKSIDIERRNEKKRTNKLCFDFNNTYQENGHSTFHFKLLKQMIGEFGENSIILQPFSVDLGKNLFIGKEVFINHSCTILNGAPVIIGNNVRMAPNVGIYTDTHPIHPISRRDIVDCNSEIIIIQDNVWIGGHSTILPGVTIGENTVIGAGSVVTKDIPSNVVAVGNPCRILYSITDDMKYKLFKDKEITQEQWEQGLQRNNKNRS